MALTLETAGAQTVPEARDLHSWRPERTEVQRRQGMWRTVVPLSSGHYRYRYMVDGRRQPAPLIPEVEPALSGADNTLFIAGNPERKTQ